MEKHRLTLTLDGDFCETVIVDEKQKRLLEYFLSQNYFYSDVNMTFESIGVPYKDFTL